MKTLFLILFVTACVISGCNNETITPETEKQCSMEKSNITQVTINKVIKNLTDKYGSDLKFRIERGVNQTASLWRKDNGDEAAFEEFCMQNFIGSEEELDKVFERLSMYYEVLSGNFNKITLELRKPLDHDMGELLPIDRLFGAYNAGAHLNEDLYANKIAFHVTLNFPSYTLKEKSELGPEWTRKQWAYARIGDMYISRVPAELIQKASEAGTNAGTYIAEYNIYMGNLVDNNNRTLFPEDLKLITHWGLRDELKSNYNAENGLEKQKMIYEVMKKIISQDIPECVINSNEYTWNPFSNTVTKDDKEIKFKPEPDTRYEHLLNNFHAMKNMDPYNPLYPDFIQRAFDRSKEVAFGEVEKLFISYISSPQVKKVAELIKKRLGRDLEPFDIWYDGFKSRSSISEEELNKITRSKYPDKEAFQKDLPNILTKLGFSSEDAEFITSKVTVDPSRGAGHAWGAAMRSDNAHLRTRIGENGMDYKGYNIAVHEFGHNVEQTISLQNVDHYMLQGVPSTAFTEALAFIFQKRDLDLLGIKDNNPDKKHLLVLDNFWSTYEIMGVSLVDMYVWQWMYDNPEADEKQLKEAVISIAKDVWNKYYAEPLGIKDQTILAIYSHMIARQLYLSAYPTGMLIESQVEQYIEDKDLAEEVKRIYAIGRIIPQEWMKEAVGSKISAEPVLKAVDEALEAVGNRQ